MRIQAILAVFCLLAPINASAHHQFANENLVEILPSGFILGSQSSSGALKRTEFVPQAETVNGWSELITTDVFFGNCSGPSGIGVRPGTVSERLRWPGGQICG